MQRHLSTGTTLVSALMAAQRRGDPDPQAGRDVVALLASLGDRTRHALSPRPAPRDEDPPPAAR